MGEGALQVWLVVKWLIPAAIGSGLAVFIDDTENKLTAKAWWFFYGASISVIAGSAFIEWQNIQAQTMQGLIYFGIGVWGMGLSIQITKKIPSFINQIADKVSLIIDRFAEKFLK